MSLEDPSLDLLAYHAFPRLAAALQSRFDAIIHEWETAVCRTLPAADELTFQQLRNSLPLILQEIVDAFASDKPRATQELMEGSKKHGAARFHGSYNVQELMVEYRLFRRIIIEQVSKTLGGELDTQNEVALNMALDTVLEGGIVTFTEHQQQQIKIATEVQAKYLSYLSHDVRNHLNNAMVHLQLLALELAQAPEYSKSVERIQSIKRAILMTTGGMDRLLQAEQLRQGSVEPRAHPVNLNSLLSEAAEQLQPQAKSKGLELDVDVPEGAQASSDSELLMLVLQNLIGNAVKYSLTGKVKITARNTPDGKKGGWVFSVSDQGPGIAPENVRHLFDAFRRGDTYGNPGVGLGLSIASRAAKLLGGRLEIESEVNVGSTFRLVLPSHSPSDTRIK